MPTLKSLYHLWSAPGTSVYNAQGTLIGTTTAYKAIAHNGKCIGSIQIDTIEKTDSQAIIRNYVHENDNVIQMVCRGISKYNGNLSQTIAITRTVSEWH